MEKESTGRHSGKPEGKHSAHQKALKVCCQETIKAHAIYNPMMLCQVCKHLIKCFQNEASFRNYIKFCESRGRQIYTDCFESYRVVVFRNYEPFR